MRDRRSKLNDRPFARGCGPPVAEPPFGPRHPECTSPLDAVSGARPRFGALLFPFLSLRADRGKRAGARGRRKERGESLRGRAGKCEARGSNAVLRERGRDVRRDCRPLRESNREVQGGTLESGETTPGRGRSARGGGEISFERAGSATGAGRPTAGGASRTRRACRIARDAEEKTRIARGRFADRR